jgi:alanine or glycine:cation symporter, AGCS family
VKTADLAWGLGDLGVGMMAWLNIGAILLMHKVAYTCLKDYEAQKKQGLDPVFDPEKLGIKNADYWTGKKGTDAAEAPAAEAQPESAR